jgi:hypothetical protein
LIFNDPIIAHYLRWLAENDPNEKTAYLVMSGQTEKTRLEIARLGGTLGGPKTQLVLKKNQKGWFNPNEQAKRGHKAAEINRLNQTGAWSSENLETLAKGGETMKNNPDIYLLQKLENLQKGRETQKKDGMNLGNKETQRFKSFQYWGVVLNGVRDFIDTEQRCDSIIPFVMHRLKRQNRFQNLWTPSLALRAEQASKK